MARARDPTVTPRLISGPGRVRDVRLTVAGRVRAKRDWIHHRFAIHAVGLVVGGRGTYRVDDGPEVEMGPGSLFAVFPGATFHYGPRAGTTWDECHVGGLGPGVGRWLEAGWLWTDGAVRRVHGLAEATRRFDEVAEIARGGAPSDIDRAVLLAERLLLELTLDAEGGRAPDRIDEALESLGRRADKPVDWAALARDHRMSESTLRAGCRRRTGLPPGRYLARLRCDRAAALLTETGLSVAEIADRVGYVDAPTFSKAFKRTVGLSPDHYRTRAQLPGGKKKPTASGRGLRDD
ncbi:MAG: AraC family transcriptional regulator [Planctomycetota bacterium]